MVISKPMEQDRQLYEVACLISPACSEEEVRAFQQSLKNEVQNLGGLIDPAAGGEGDVVKRRLFYPIKNMTEAYLASFRFLLPSEKISEFKTKLKAPQILRFILVHTKRQPTRTYRPRLEKISGPETITTPIERKIRPIEPASPAGRPVAKTAEPKVEPAANIEEIDKKLEEILGK